MRVFLCALLLTTLHFDAGSSRELSRQAGGIQRRLQFLPPVDYGEEEIGEIDAQPSQESPVKTPTESDAAFQCSRCPSATCVTCRCWDGVCMIEEKDLSFAGFTQGSIFLLEPAEERLEEEDTAELDLAPKLTGPRVETPTEADPERIEARDIVIGHLTAEVAQLVCNQCREEKCVELAWWCK